MSDSGLTLPTRTEAQALRERIERRHGVKVITHYNPPPIPTRNWDWSAVTDNYEAWTDNGEWVTTHPMGNGATEAEAIADLGEQLDEKETV